MSLSVNQKFFLCVISGIITGLTHQPFSIGFIAWISLIPFLYSIQSLITKKRIITAGFLFGLSYSSTQIFWLSMNIGTSPLIAKITMISASLYLSIFHIIFALISFRIKNISPWLGAWSMAFIWVDGLACPEWSGKHPPIFRIKFPARQVGFQPAGGRTFLTTANVFFTTGPGGALQQKRGLFCCRAESASDQS